MLLRSFFRQFAPENIPKEYWSYAKGDISKAELFELYPKQAVDAAAEARCIELGKTPYQEVKNLIIQRLNGSNKWVLVGGPPCQAYSMVGRARMKTTNPDFEDDIRHFLYKECKSGLGYKLFSLVDNQLPEKCEPEDFLVRAELYGIPQARHRMLILGIRDDIHITPDILQKSESTSVEQAIGDLPKIRSKVSKEVDTLELWQEILCSASSEVWYRAGRKNGLVNTVKIMDGALAEIQKHDLMTGAETMRYTGRPKIFSDWYRHGCDGVVTNHAGRGHMRSDLHRYLFASAFAAANGRTAHLCDFPTALLPAHNNVQEGVKNNHFSDRFRAQVAGNPSTTVTSHISKDGHYFIHYDPSQCRSLTVREAARLQTFPDSYKFEGGRTSQECRAATAIKAGRRDSPRYFKAHEGLAWIRCPLKNAVGICPASGEPTRSLRLLSARCSTAWGIGSE